MRNERSRELFGMYEGLDTREDVSLKIEDPTPESELKPEGSCLITPEKNIPHPPGSSFSMTFEVPEGEYWVKAEALVKAASRESHKDAVWHLEAQGDSKMGSNIGGVYGECSEIGGTWVGIARPVDGQLTLELKWEPDFPSPEKTVYVYWVKLSYERDDVWEAKRRGE